ncbi:MAG: tetratricopeptide repeat protein [Deltaproteobacteria bacterium]|nr:tetratricopeptide repeat protein [Deltaproteobacteria bacterium]MBW2051235.1 tetratricopeptide repeat protein [Deltaproteobacteria bacterium]MBW2141156.1 tetratricopeptide repeat protein [Deltaproteobacteria bacterium]
MDINGDPLAFTEEVGVEEFRRHFTLQPDYDENVKSLNDIKIGRIIDKAQEHYEKKEYLSAEYEFNRALDLDEENLRANFGVGKVYLSMGEPEKAVGVFEKVSQVEAVFEKKNKHVFNELGIELRKLGLHRQAVSFYKKALSFVKDDEHLYFNIGRAYYMDGDINSAGKYVKKALKLNPSLPEAKQLFTQIFEKRSHLKS